MISKNISLLAWIAIDVGVLIPLIWIMWRLFAVGLTPDVNDVPTLYDLLVAFITPIVVGLFAGSLIYGLGTLGMRLFRPSTRNEHVD